MQKKVLMDSETIIRKVLSALTHFKLTEQIHHNNSVVKGANKLFDGPSISLYDLNWKYNKNLGIIIITIIIIMTIIMIIIIVIIVIIIIIIIIAMIMILKYQVAIRWEPCLMARLGSLALDNSLSRDSVSIKKQVVVSPHQRCPLPE